MSEEAPEWFAKWDWEWRPEDLAILAIDPEGEDVTVCRFAMEPDPKVLNMIMESREVILNIETLIDRKIAEKRTKVTNVNLVLKGGLHRLENAIKAGALPLQNQKLTASRFQKLVENLFKQLNSIMLIQAETEKIDETDEKNDR